MSKTAISYPPFEYSINDSIRSRTIPQVEPDQHPILLNASAPADRPCVLFVDDCPIGRKLFEKTLNLMKIPSMVAGDGAKAIEQIEASARRVALVITDYEMPNLNGVNLVRELRLRNFGGTICMSSSMSLSAIASIHGELEIDAFVSKPLLPDALKILISDAMASFPA